MRSGLKTGSKIEITRHINESQTITFDGLPPVLATPFLVWMLEESAMSLIAEFLEEDELTLGTQIDIEHLGMARIGDEVIFSATMIQMEGRQLLFNVQATNHGKLISKGLHRRTLVSKSKLIKKLS
ncbi:MAG: hypothetical protein HON04_18805 [Planctomicrobium sp.]|nr:hypothetical protein [Planctomicrobium sp.]